MNMPRGVYVRTKEARENISKALKGRKLSPETVEKIVSKTKGRKRSEEFCKRMSESRKGDGNPMYGRKLKPEHIEAIRSANIGVTVPEETKKQIAEKVREYHKNNPRTEETRRKISEGVRGSYKPRYNMLKLLDVNRIRDKTGHELTAEKLRGRSLPEEHRRKISESNMGKRFTEDHKQKLSEYRRGVYVGENCPAWKGGISFEPYCPKFNHNFKWRVREFFNNTCVMCGKQKGVNYNRNLVVHHVNYDKEVCCNENQRLFVTLCTSCHAKTNDGREFWESHFTYIINSRYNGTCYLPKE
jgi:hypothetical protein